jgi:hypothetical protein
MMLLGCRDVANTSFPGEVPAALGVLTALTHLNLRGCDLESSIPTEIGYLTALQFVDLSHNNLQYALPTEIGLLVALTELHIQYNRFAPTFYCSHSRAFASCRCFTAFSPIAAFSPK